MLTPRGADELRKLLEVVGINRAGEHPVFGKLDELLQSFVTTNYLHRVRKAATDTFEIGPRAMHEFPTLQRYQFVNRVVGRNSMEVEHASTLEKRARERDAFFTESRKPASSQKAAEPT